jgi:hypothetical protein
VQSDQELWIGKAISLNGSSSGVRRAMPWETPTITWRHTRAVIEAEWLHRSRPRAIYATLFFGMCLPLMFLLMLAHTILPFLRIYTAEDGMACVAICPAWLSNSRRAHWLLYNGGSFDPRLKGQMADLWDYLGTVAAAPQGPSLHTRAGSQRVAKHYESKGFSRRSPGGLWMTYAPNHC